MPETTEHHFTDIETEDLLEYKRVSLLALAAAGCGVLSIAVLATPYMLWLPILAVLLAIAAITAIARRPDILFGRKMAAVGLCLALLFTSYAVANQLGRSHHLYRDAKPHCIAWLRLVLEGKLHEAHQLQMDQGDRKSPSVPMEEFYKHNEDVAEDFDMFTEADLIQKLKQIGPSAQVRFVANDSIVLDYRGQTRCETVVQQYAVDYEEDGHKKSLPVLMRIERYVFEETGEAHWRVWAAEDLTEE